MEITILGILPEMLEASSKKSCIVALVITCSVQTKHVGGQASPKLTIHSLLFSWCRVLCISALGCDGQYIKLNSYRSGSHVLSNSNSPDPLLFNVGRNKGSSHHKAKNCF